MVSRVKAFCDFCGDEVPEPSEDQVVVLLGYRSYADRSDYHRADVCNDCVQGRNVLAEMVKLEKDDRANLERGQIPGSLTFGLKAGQ